MRHKRIAFKVAAIVAAALAVVCLGFFAHPLNVMAADSPAPTVDGDLSEWGKVADQASNESDVTSWKIAKDADGNVYLAITGIANSQWDQWDWVQNKGVNLTINGETTNYRLAEIAQGQSTLKGSYVVKNDASGNTKGLMTVEIKLDASSFNGLSDWSINYAGTTVNASDIGTLDGKASDAGSDDSSTSADPATYDGIKIDGDFSDWNAVTKYDTEDPNPEHHQNLAQEAMIFDGDYVYIYVREGEGGSAAGAGTHSNGNFAITTDLGSSLMVHLSKDEKGDASVTAGGTPVDCKNFGHEWEIAIPKSMLPRYEKTINFGLYQSDPVVKDVSNIKDDSGNASGFSGITYDGDYSDWKDYPHTMIQYATPGTQETVQDGEGALYNKDGMLYTHVESDMKAHTQNEAGGEFLEAVTYDLGDGRYYTPNFYEVDSQGNMRLVSGAQTPGTHEYYLFDTAGWNNSTNINNLSAGDHNYGKVTITVNTDGSVDEMESEIDLQKLAKDKFNCDATDFKTIKAQFGRIGQEWITDGGTSSGPWLGILIAVASVVVTVAGFGIYQGRHGWPALFKGRA